MSDLIVVRSQSRSPAETGLAWCSLKHFRFIHGSVPVSRAPHLHAGPCGARMPALEVAQVHVVSQLPLQRARFQFSIGEILRFTAHHRFDRQLFGKTPGRDNSDCPSLNTNNPHNGLHPVEFCLHRDKGIYSLWAFGFTTP